MDFPLVRAEIGHEEEVFFDRADCSRAQAGRDGPGGLGPGPADRSLGADLLLLEEAVWRAVVGAGPRAESTG